MLKLLDICCGLGGWSKGFEKFGWQCTGIDNRDLGYSHGKFILADIYDWEPEEKYHCVVASTPCTEFSVAKYYGWGTQKEREGLDLVQRALYLIYKIRPRYWILENVKHLSDFIGEPKKIVHYNSFSGGKKAYLWGRFPDFPVVGKIDYLNAKWGNSHPMRSLIPEPLADGLAYAVTKRLLYHKSVSLSCKKRNPNLSRNTRG